MFNLLLFNFIFILFPIMFYLFFIAYNKTVNKKESNLLLNCTLLSSFYLGFKYSNENICEIFLMLSIIPLVISYVKRNNDSVILLTIVQMSCFTFFYNFNIFFLFLEYILYFVCYEVLNKKTFVVTAICLKLLFIVFQLWNIGYYGDLFIFNKYLYIIFIGILTFIVYEFVILIIIKGENILRYHMSVRELEREKQVRNSLFKIAHEIKNPMAVCKGYFDMLDMNNDEQVRRYLPIIKEEIDHTLLILKDFLSITKVKVEKDLMDICMLMEEVMTSFKPILKYKNINADFDLFDDEVYINGDYGRIKQVLINVIKNSIESINHDHGMISVKTRKNNDYFEIIIKDNGIGMDIENLNHLFEPFYTTKKNGTGLGICLSQEILKMHDANIKYVSKKNEGTTVIISIPIK